jgi:hypothetical protein
MIKKVVINKNYSINGNTIVIDYGDNGKDVAVSTLSSIRQLSNLDKIKTVFEYYYEFFKLLNIDQAINFSKILGNKKTIEYVNYLKSSIDESLLIINDYHFNIFPIRKQCYENLNQVILDGNKLDLPTYNHSGVTGRTSIKKGFNFLTLKKEKRKDLKPINPDNVLVEIDFKSCEPFFYLKSQNINVYKWISDKYNIDFDNRSRVKQGILSMIYGANEKVISRLMGVKEAKVKLIKSDLGINDLEKRIEKEFNKKGHFLNYYGRPITSNNNIVNYWIQSSTVDFCSLAFDNLCKVLNVRPSFFIHDSMTIEISRNMFNSLKNTNSIKDPISNISIPVEITIINE